MPANFRGRPGWYVQLWWLTQATLFRGSPQVLYRFRAWLLRCFGAQVGRNTIIRPTATITYPWKVTIGDFAWIGDHVTLYSLGTISIGDHAVISQHTYVCAGDHDPLRSDFPIRGPAVVIEDEAWVACGAFVGPGVTIGKGAVIGAYSAVFKNMPAGMVCVGNPCVPRKARTMCADPAPSTFFDSPRPQNSHEKRSSL
jgi:putative colanic acid biosynthesis acetyltransferase WcaF